MKNKYIIGILLIAAIFSLSSLASGLTLDEHISESDINENTAFGAGSDFPLITPYTGGWISGTEPKSVTWTIYDPGYHKVYEMTHVPSTKYQKADSDWVFADKTVFTLPAFASQGWWAASCDVTYVNGVTEPLHFGDYLFTGIPCDNPGDWIGNIFLYPWYGLNIKMPAVFWFPGVLLWIWPLMIGIAMLFNRYFPNLATGLRSVIDTARKTVRGKRRSKAKK